MRSTPGLLLLLPLLASPAIAAPARDLHPLVAEWEASFNSHDLERAAKVFSPHAVVAGIKAGGWVEERGPVAVRKSLEPYFIAFPDVRLAITRVFHQGDLVIAEWVSDGTNQGSLAGAPPTNKRAGIHGLSFLTFDARGLISRSETVFDEITVAQQLGLAPGPARAVPAWPTEKAVWVEAGDPAAEARVAAAARATWPATWNKRDLKAYDAVITDDAVHKELAGPNDFVGRQANLGELATYAKALPDMHADIQKVWGFGNFAIMKFTFKGTMKGPLGPIPATNRPVVIHGVDVDELRDGKMAVGLTYSNAVEMLTHLGVLTAKR
jgi:steroid delta-isomerase-like uncharacterized protein